MSASFVKKKMKKFFVYAREGISFASTAYSSFSQSKRLFIVLFAGGRSEICYISSNGNRTINILLLCD
jgi:hypothetical protein